MRFPIITLPALQYQITTRAYRPTLGMPGITDEISLTTASYTALGVIDSIILHTGNGLDQLRESC
ncbi:MAG: hypothetical protein AB2531_11445, partial [Candidatus Thiodiazotropha sp.]